MSREKKRRGSEGQATRAFIQRPEMTITCIASIKYSHRHGGGIMKLSLQPTVKFTKRIVVNGREYVKPEDMPEDVRKLYGNAMQKIAHDGIESGGVVSSTKIVFNGREYSSIGEMPGKERSLYKAALGAVESEQDGARAASTRELQQVSVKDYAAPIEPASGGFGLSRSKMFLALAGLLLAAFLLVVRFSRGY
jgi:hypothetical protein